MSERTEKTLSRRSLLAGAAAAFAGVALAPGVTLVEVAKAGGQPVSSKVRWGLLIDASLCNEGCEECVLACNRENGLSGGTRPTDSQWIRKVELKDRRSGAKVNLPVMCQHCAEPPCVDVCPTGASFKRADGIVLVDRHICIGCRYCMMACPYKARSFVHETLSTQKPDVPRGKGCVESCTLCVQRIDRGEKTTACSEACPTRAIVFGDLNDPNSEISRRVAQIRTTQLRADLGLDTGVRYTGI
ncbi:MAG: sulfate reduction electron transfer complex DsrMKJOP subunit DsrO [Gemmatimonadota bacterium]